MNHYKGSWVSRGAILAYLNLPVSKTPLESGSPPQTKYTTKHFFLTSPYSYSVQGFTVHFEVCLDKCMSGFISVGRHDVWSKRCRWPIFFFIVEMFFKPKAWMIVFCFEWMQAGDVKRLLYKTAVAGGVGFSPFVTKHSQSHQLCFPSFLLWKSTEVLLDL